MKPAEYDLDSPGIFQETASNIYEYRHMSVPYERKLEFAIGAVIDFLVDQGYRDISDQLIEILRLKEIPVEYYT